MKISPYSYEPFWPKVLNFHNVFPILDKSDPYHAWNNSVEQVKRIVLYLQENLEIIDLADFQSIVENKGNAEGKFLLTFDDGYKNIHTHLLPFFREHGIKPTVFLIADVYRERFVPWYLKFALLLRHSQKRTIIYEKQEYDLDNREQKFNFYRQIEQVSFSKSPEIVEKILKDLYQQVEHLDYHSISLDEDMQFLSKSEVQELIDEGWGIGSHGCSHRPLSQVNAEQLQDEFSESKIFLEETFGVKVNSISYPNGGYNEQVLKSAEDFYDFGFINNPYVERFGKLKIPRIYERKVFGIHLVPQHRKKLAMQVDHYLRSKHKKGKLVQLLKMISTPQNWQLLSIPDERKFIANSLQHYISQRSKKKKKGFREVKPIIKTNKVGSKKGKKVMLLCGPNPPERKAAYELSKHYNISSIIIHNYASRTVRFVQNQPDYKGSGKETSKLVYPYFQWLNEEQKQILGHESLAWFMENDTQIFETSNINSPEVLDKIKEVQPDVLLVFGTGIIKKEILELDVPKYNLHWGYSPQYRGSFTLRWPIYNEDLKHLGVTLHQLSAVIDGGGIAQRRKLKLDGTETLEEIEYKGTRLGIEMFSDLLDKTENDQALNIQKQDLGIGKNYRSKAYTAEIDKTIRRKLSEGIVFKTSREGDNEE